MKGGKLDQTASKGVFVGYSQTTRQYRILDPGDMSVKQHSSVRFDELQSGSILLKKDQQETQEGFELLLDLGASRDSRDESRVERDSSRIREITEEQAEPDRDDLESNIDIYRQATLEHADPPNNVTTGRPQRN